MVVSECWDRQAGSIGEVANPNQIVVAERLLVIRHEGSLMSTVA